MLTTSPYVLWETSPDGSEHLCSIDGRSRVPVSTDWVELLRTFLQPGRPQEGGQKFADSLIEQALEAGFLVEDVSAHRERVFAAFERRFDREHPRLGYIETTTRCPVSCVMCPRSAPTFDRPNGSMEVALFEVIVGQLKHQQEVVLHLFGDPLMDRHVFERVVLVRKHGLRTIFSTNAMLLGPAVVKKLLTSGPDRLVVSCDATSSETYRRVRGTRARFDISAHRLDAFVRAWRQSGRPFELVLRFVNLDLNLAERASFVEQWSDEEHLELDIKNHLRFPDVPALLDEQARRPEGKRFFLQALGGRGPVKCTRHWFSQPAGELAVQIDGTVVPCCLAYSREVALGNLRTETLIDIWQGRRFTELRRALFFREEIDAFSLCARCNHDLS